MKKIITLAFVVVATLTFVAFDVAAFGGADQPGGRMTQNKENVPDCKIDKDKDGNPCCKKRFFGGSCNCYCKKPNSDNLNMC